MIDTDRVEHHRTMPRSRRSYRLACPRSASRYKRLHALAVYLAPAMSDHASSATFSFPHALLASGPSAGPGTQREVYAGLIGSWDAEVVDHLPQGARRQSAEVHFAWILEGRAVQDVWIVPARRERGPGLRGENDRYGTTLRCYDPVLDAWRITWWNSCSGIESRLVGRRVEGCIVHTGADAEGRLMRWTFVELTAHTFHWQGERSADGGRSWLCESEYFGRRRAEKPRRVENPEEVVEAVSPAPTSVQDGPPRSNPGPRT